MSNSNVVAKRYPSIAAMTLASWGIVIACVLVLFALGGMNDAAKDACIQSAEICEFYVR